MSKARGQILWIDDEINHLKPHILFLKEKGYAVSTANSGKDGIFKAKEQAFDVILLDQFMPGLDGMETLNSLKEANPAIPIIMITKIEEEWLMDEAISKKISTLLIKPVNPNQIFMACKQILEDLKIRSEKSSQNYLKEFQEIERDSDSAKSLYEWWSVYSKMVNWQLDFEIQDEDSLVQILDEQFKSCNRKFSKFVDLNYVNWLQSKDRPILSTDIFSSKIKPLLENNEKVCLVVMDAMRLDQFLELYPLMAKEFSIDIEPSLSILPTATPFSRNAIFAGMFPDEICKKYPEQLDAISQDSGSLNKMESIFLEGQLKKFGFNEKSFYYQKIWVAEEGKRFLNKINNFTNNDMLAIVVNFVDQLAHRRSESDVLKEMVPDETGYRHAVAAWYKNSWIRSVLSEIKKQNYKVVMTSDHGSIMVNRGSIVAADKNSSSGLRYKYGRNINAPEKTALDIRDLKKYKLPDFGPQTNYIVAKDDFFFLYPNDSKKYNDRLKRSFQHGGISMEEMLIPILTMTPR